MKVQYITPEWVPRMWPKVEPFICSALEHAQGDYTLVEIRTLLSTGQWALLAAVDDENVIHGAATVHFFNRPSARVAFITAIGGRLITSKDTFSQLCAQLSAAGATCIEGAARESIARLWRRYGFAVKYSIVGVKL